MTSLPLAPDRAVVSNRISMLLANRASLFKSPTQTARDKDKPRDDDDWLSGAGRPNEGVGYVAGPSETVAGGISGRAGRVLAKGKRKADDGRTKTRAESDDDDDEGRCGVGRRKRQRQNDVDGIERQKEVNSQEGLGPTPDLSNSHPPNGHHAATNHMEGKKKKKAKKRKT